MTEPLRKKSVHQVRAIAQSFGIPDIFSMPFEQLCQAIELKQQKLLPQAKVEIPPPAYDARLMTKPPARKSDESMVRELLDQYVKQGMHLTFDEERWYMRHGKKTDEGTLRMPPRVILNCARKLMA